MKNNGNMRIYAWLEFVIWLIVIAILVLGIRYSYYQKQKEFKNYQIFMEDVDGLIIGSPVRFLGVQIGYVKKIKIISSDVYIKFTVTQKDLVLPSGAIATVEGTGLGGSKSLEIYPPDKNNPTDKIIQSKDPTRLNKVMGLFDSIFKELDSIITTINYASTQFESNKNEQIQKNVISPVEPNEVIDKFDKNLDKIINSKNKFIKNIKNK